MKIERDLFGSILFLALQWKIDMVEMLKFPLTPAPLCLPHIDGSMQRPPKSSLLNDLETRVLSEAPSNVDTFNWWHVLPAAYSRITRKVGLLAKSILKKVCTVSNAYRIDLIFDKANLPSIKDCER